VNRPLASANAVLTEAGARAEVRVSGASLTLGEGTQLALTRIDEDAIDAMVAAGSVIVRLRLKARAERYTIATPQASFVIDAEGTYRIDYDPVSDESRLMVSSGSAHMAGPRGNIVVTTGKTLHLAGDDDPSSGIESGMEEDELDQWARSRESGWSDSAARKYVSPYMTGYEDLDANGQWATDPDYGAVWTPSNVEASWAPYSDGRWANVQPWGWTWIDNAPWGYAPFHYGRWVYVRDRWGWSPGPRVGRPVYAPALVGWTGGTPGPSASGWYPLAPWERLQPWYRANPAYVDRVNVTVRDRPAPRDGRGAAEGWRNWNRDHATTTNRGHFPPRNPEPTARPKPVNADALRRARDPAQSRQQHPPREARPTPPRATPPAQVVRPPAQPPQPQAQPQPQRPAAPAQHPAERSEKSQER
jgi:hypothetical protein